MVRTQIYLAEKERAALSRLAARSGKKQSELIRQAVDEFVARFEEEHRQAVLSRAAGLWKRRKDLPDFAKLRREWDRGAAT